MPRLRIARCHVLCAGVLLGCAACSDDGDPASLDAATVDALTVDAPATIDAGVCTQFFPTCWPTAVPDPALCAAAVPLEPGAPRLGQDSAGGGYGDCASSGSGIGGPSLYYRITVPAGRIARVAATPTAPDQDGLVRALTDCSATAAFASGRGGMITQGEAAVCLDNPDSAPRAYVIAVSRYSGEADCLPLAFDVAIDVRLPNDGCQEIE